MTLLAITPEKDTHAQNRERVPLNQLQAQFCLYGKVTNDIYRNRQINPSSCVYVWMDVCMCVCMYVYVCMYVCMYARMYVCM